MMLNLAGAVVVGSSMTSHGTPPAPAPSTVHGQCLHLHCPFGCDIENDVCHPAPLPQPFEEPDSFGDIDNVGANELDLVESIPAAPAGTHYCYNPDAKNHYKDCDWWAGHEQCEQNPGFMWYYCCDACKPVDAICSYSYDAKGEFCNKNEPKGYPGDSSGWFYELEDGSSCRDHKHGWAGNPGCGGHKCDKLIKPCEVRPAARGGRDCSSQGYLSYREFHEETAPCPTPAPPPRCYKDTSFDDGWGPGIYCTEASGAYNRILPSDCGKFGRLWWAVVDLYKCNPSWSGLLGACGKACPTSAPTSAPTPVPTSTPTASPTPEHPCDDGSHGCDKNPGGICYKIEHDSNLLYHCGCMEGYYCKEGCDNNIFHLAFTYSNSWKSKNPHVCLKVTSAPTPAPTPAPTNKPTNYPTPFPTPSPTLYPSPAPTSYPTPYPTTYPTPHPCTDGSHGCDKTHGLCYRGRGNRWSCGCDHTHWCSEGCEEPHISHTCVLKTPSPTPAPTPAPTNILDHAKCLHTSCVYKKVDGFYQTLVQGVHNSNEHFHCEHVKTEPTGCKCVCDRSLQCTILHHHQLGDRTPKLFRERC